MVNDVRVSPDGRTLASAGKDWQIKLWSTADGRLLDTLVGHTAAVTSLTFAPDGRTLVSGSSDRTVRLWSLP